MGEYPRAKFSHLSTDAQEISTFFAAHEIPASKKFYKLVGLISWAAQLVQNVNYSNYSIHLSDF